MTDVVFNTEAHPFPRFQLNKLLFTGWERKPRGSGASAAPADSKLTIDKKAEQTQQITEETPGKGKITETLLTPKVFDPKLAEQAPVDANAHGGAQAKVQDSAEQGGLDPITGKERDGSP